MDEWEISFNLQAAERSKSFHFLVNSVKSPDKPLPSFPKDKFLRALKSHSIENKYVLHTGTLTKLSFKKTKEYDDSQEIHIIMLVFEKMGPISLIFRESFSYLKLEAIDSNYDYIGHQALLNVLIQIIKPDSPTVKGLGKINTIYHASNEKELTKKQTFVPFLDSTEGQVLTFSLSIILPTVIIIILPLSVLDTTLGYITCLGILTILWCIYPIAKRSFRHAPLVLVSALTSYLILEILIHLNILLGGINPWGIFNNISRQNLIGILQNQTLIANLGNQVGFGLGLLQSTIPFFDIIIIAFIPFTVGVGAAGLIEKFDMRLSKIMILRTFFMALLLSTIIIIPLTYHMLGKGTEGTLHASIGIIETAEMFTPKYIENLAENYDELLKLIFSAQEHLLKAGNSFEQFGQNPLIAYLLPLLIPEVAGIPLADLPNILTLTNVVAETIPYYPNILWAFNHLTEGLNQSFDILMNSIQGITQEGIGSAVFQDYNLQMKEALSLMQKGVNNLTSAELPLTNLINQVQEKLDYSIFAELSDLLTTIEIGLPVLITVISSSIPWINSTYKLTIALDEFLDLNFDPNQLTSAKLDFENSQDILSIDLEGLPTNTLIPLNDLVSFSQNFHELTKYLIFSVANSTDMFKALNGTLSNFEGIDFSNSSNIHSEIWNNVENGLHNTSDSLNLTKISLNQMSSVIEAQKAMEFEELAELNIFIDNLEIFTEDASDRFDVIDSYFSALNTSYWSIRYFSMGSNSLNQSITITIETNSSFDANQAIANFTQCQIVANLTDVTLSGINSHLLNESSIENWRNLIRGNITTNETNSVYMNAQLSLDLINQIELDVLNIMTRYGEFQIILTRMEDLDWSIFNFEI
ncbi:MAG: hypothetical protein ACFFAU_15295 [Candidatus Hodarchaeota archaeon]